MTLSERFSPEIAGFVEAMALVIASDDVVADEEMGIVADTLSAGNPVFAGFTEIDNTLVLEYTKSRALEIVASSYATVGGEEDDQVKFLALIKQSLTTISQAAVHKDEILAVAHKIVAADGVMAEEEEAMMTCLESCLVSGASQAFRDLFGIAA